MQLSVRACQHTTRSSCTVLSVSQCYLRPFHVSFCWSSFDVRSLARDRVHGTVRRCRERVQQVNQMWQKLTFVSHHLIWRGSGQTLFSHVQLERGGVAAGPHTAGGAVPWPSTSVTARMSSSERRQSVSRAERFSSIWVVLRVRGLAVTPS
jgi:hypothetical protein